MCVRERERECVWCVPVIIEYKIKVPKYTISDCVCMWCQLLPYLTTAPDSTDGDPTTPPTKNQRNKVNIVMLFY